MADDSFYKMMLENLHDGVYFVDKERKITYWNKGAERITGFTREEVKESYCFNNILNHVDREGNKLCIEGCPLHETLIDGMQRTTEVFVHHKKGHRIPVFVRTIAIEEDGKVVGAVEIFNDDTERLEIINNIEKLKDLAMTDELTELPNRRYLNTYLDSKISELKALGLRFGVAFLDIDDFKKINDQYGHDVGDDMINLVAKTGLNALKKTDLLGRWGGEEYVAIFIGVDERELAIRAEQLRFYIEHSALRKGTNSIGVTVSIGATMAKESDSTNNLIDRADGLMYLSKMNGKNRVTLIS